jgi:HD-GYP domain-containing protein (c-di-GMP phosphodiesterase class II)
MFSVKRAKILHHVLLVLMFASVGPLGFYGYQVIQINREKLQTQERFSQISIARSVARFISFYLNSAREQLEGFQASALDLRGGAYQMTQLEDNRFLEKKLEDFVTRSKNLLYIHMVNSRGRGVRAGVYNDNEEGVIQHFLAKAFQHASQNQPYMSEPLTIEMGNQIRPVIIMSTPIRRQDQWVGATTVILGLDDILHWVTENSVAEKKVYVVDFNGQIVVHPDPKTKPAGMDFSRIEIVQAFMEEWRESQGIVRLQGETRSFKLEEDGQEKEMLGTFYALAEAPWGVIVQIDQKAAFATVADMKAETIKLGTLMLLLSACVGLLSARAITNPIQQLAESTHSIAKGDFSKKIQIKSRTEIGELAETFNKMTDDLELYIQQIRKAGEDNKALFEGTIQALAAAVDERDPYTRGHSQRVTDYSVVLARTLGLDEITIERTIRISAQLHDVGKIGIDDKVLKKPGFLTPEEFEIMKQHTVKGFNIMKSIEPMRDMLPGLKHHHEQWDGNGYPDRLKGEAIPLIARIIAVADTLDAMTTNRPYQQALTFEFAVEKINKNAGIKYDPAIVKAFNQAIQSGDLVVNIAPSRHPVAI